MVRCSVLGCKSDSERKIPDLYRIVPDLSFEIKTCFPTTSSSVSSHIEENMEVDDDSKAQIDSNPVASPTNCSDSDVELLENFEYTDLPKDINEDKEENLADSKYADLQMQLKKAQDRIKTQCRIIRTLKQKIRRQASTLTVLKTVLREFGKKKKKSLQKICSSDVFRVVSGTRKMNGREKNAAAVKTERPISPSCSEDDDGTGPVGPGPFLEDCDQCLSEDLSNFDKEHTKVGYRNKKLNKKIKVEIQPNLGDFTMSSSNDELSPNISKDDTPRLTPVPSTSTDASEFPPAHNPTQTALSEFHSALIREVQKHPCLYDHMNPAYDNVLIKGHIWVEIGKTIGSLETTCQSEWSNIQDAYVISFNNPSIPYLGPDVRFLDRYIINQEETVIIAPIDIKAEDPLECEIKTERDDEEDKQSGVFVPVHKKRKVEINLKNTDVTTEMAPKIESIVGNFKNDDEEITTQEASSISQKIKQEESDDVGENSSSQYMLYF